MACLLGAHDKYVGTCIKFLDAQKSVCQFENKTSEDTKEVAAVVRI